MVGILSRTFLMSGGFLSAGSWAGLGSPRMRCGFGAWRWVDATGFAFPTYECFFGRLKGLFLRLDLAVAGRRADGNRKKARKLFTSSLMDPTGNSLAQAEWASFQISSFVRATSSMYLTAEESSEARAFHHYRVRQYRESIDACEAWRRMSHSQRGRFNSPR